MRNILLNYLEDRYQNQPPKSKKKTPGPVITISREFGCPANLCAQDLADILTKAEGRNKDPWKVINKEILERASMELGLTPEKIEFVFKFEKRSTVDEILMSLSSKYYKSERKIRNTIREVIRSIGEQGHVIIVGRAGSVILQDIQSSLHVKLVAPTDFRVKGVSRRHKIPQSEAKQITDDMDENRSQLRREFSGKPDSKTNYDVVLNCEKLKIDSIVGLIARAAEDHGLI